MSAKKKWCNGKHFSQWRYWKNGFKDHLVPNGDQSKRRRRYVKAFSISDRFYFRGQADSEWDLIASFDRVNTVISKRRLEEEKKLVNQFYEELRRYEALDDESDHLRKAALAQHHGVPTRLLDWSTSPYVAAFFAFRDRLLTGQFETGHVAIWALDRPALKEKDLEKQCRLYEVKDHHNIRLGNQFGAFTYLETKDSDDLCAFAKRIDATKVLTQFMIPAHQTIEALEDLMLMGINPASIFPGREGVASYVDLRSRLEKLREHTDERGKIVIEAHN